MTDEITTNEPVIDMDDESPHTPLSATPGSGKSMVVSGLVAQVLHNGGQAVIVDPKRHPQSGPLADWTTRLTLKLEDQLAELVLGTGAFTPAEADQWSTSAAADLTATVQEAITEPASRQNGGSPA